MQAGFRLCMLNSLTSEVRGHTCSVIYDLQLRISRLLGFWEEEQVLVWWFSWTAWPSSCLGQSFPFLQESSKYTWASMAFSQSSCAKTWILALVCVLSVHLCLLLLPVAEGSSVAQLCLWLRASCVHILGIIALFCSLDLSTEGNSTSSHS
jgi:hypothetical protein